MPLSRNVEAAAEQKPCPCCGRAYPPGEIPDFASVSASSGSITGYFSSLSDEDALFLANNEITLSELVLRMRGGSVANAHGRGALHIDVIAQRLRRDTNGGNVVNMTFSARGEEDPDGDIALGRRQPRSFRCFVCHSEHSNNGSGTVVKLLSDCEFVGGLCKFHGSECVV